MLNPTSSPSVWGKAVCWREALSSRLSETRGLLQFLCRFVNCFGQEIAACLENPPSTCNAGSAGEPCLRV